MRIQFPVICLVTIGFNTFAHAEREFVVIAERGSKVGDNYVRRFNDEMPSPRINDHGVVAFAADVVGIGWAAMTQRGVALGPGDVLTNGSVVVSMGHRSINLELNNREDLFVTGARVFIPEKLQEPTAAIRNREVIAFEGDTFGDFPIGEVLRRGSSMNDAGETLYEVFAEEPPDFDDDDETLQRALASDDKIVVANQAEYQNRPLRNFSNAFIDGQGKAAFGAHFDGAEKSFIIYDGEIIVSPGDTVRDMIVEQPRLHGMNESGTLLLGDSASGTNCCSGSRFFTLERDLLVFPEDIDELEIIGFNDQEQILYEVDNEYFLDDELIISENIQVNGLPIREVSDLAFNNRGDVVFLATVEDEDDIHVVVSTDRPANGDLNSDGSVDARDIDELSSLIRENSVDFWFDVNRDGIVTFDDHTAWVHEKRTTWFGDSNLDGEFNSADLVSVFQGDRYETSDLASWAQGDWNGDGKFDSRDFVVAFQDRGYERGPIARTVPEPHFTMMIFGGIILLTGARTSGLRAVRN